MKNIKIEVIFLNENNKITTKNSELISKKYANIIKVYANYTNSKIIGEKLYEKNFTK